MAQVQSDDSEHVAENDPRPCDNGVGTEDNVEDPVKGTGESVHEISGNEEETWEESCPICLSEFDNKAFLDDCFHILVSQSVSTAAVAVL